ncbi:hypothetical protein TRL7639_00956 [Falsiruegeria litorea R37]|uniref:Uncharacterized protein n=1 Tax=Falsiruegeria litorea R37 TaxID=1200284 RepID=A0A1Y5RXD4_9RHOB|nr:hypothetical protein [Falsiruegeria litorea]SLN26340.1 hypothetical protein TRL7639_00956 [Falsiruegeria litorea R37]
MNPSRDSCNRAASGLIEALRKQWADAWGVRMEHLLHYAILALLDTPRTPIVGTSFDCFWKRSFDPRC